MEAEVDFSKVKRLVGKWIGTQNQLFRNIYTYIYIYMWRNMYTRVYLLAAEMAVHYSIWSIFLGKLLPKRYWFIWEWWARIFFWTGVCFRGRNSNWFGRQIAILRPKMGRKCFESGNKTCTFQTHFLESFNLSFHRVDWKSGTYSSKNRTKVAVTHRQNLLEKFGHASILPVKLHWKWISQSFFPGSQSPLDLWMSLKQLFKIFIKFRMFDFIGAIFTYLHVALLTLGQFLVRKLKKSLENLPVLGLNRFIAS